MDQGYNLSVNKLCMIKEYKRLLPWQENHLLFSNTENIISYQSLENCSNYKQLEQFLGSNGFLFIYWDIVTCLINHKTIWHLCNRLGGNRYDYFQY